MGFFCVEIRYTSTYVKKNSADVSKPRLNSYGVSVCVSGNKKSSNRLPAKKAQDLCRAVVVGWRNLFSSCAVMLCQFIVLAGNRFWLYIIYHHYVLRVPYSCGVVFVFLVLAGNSFWCYVRT